MHKTCPQCGSVFLVLDDDLAFLDRLSPKIGAAVVPLPPPTLCVDCRQQRRCIFRNERSLYRRKCDATGQMIVSMYSADVPFPVYSTQVWWGDGWEALAFGRAYDPQQPFFAQFGKLLAVVPKLALMVRNSENCTYNNEMDDCKNCYMCSTTFWGEDYHYCYWVGWGRDCTDGSFLVRSELCYECLDCADCYRGFYLQDCQNCRDSYFLYDCAGCSDCFCSAGLRHKRFYFENEELSEAAYHQKISALLPLSHGTIDAGRARLAQLAQQLPRKFMHGLNTENCVGDYISNSRNCYYCFDLMDAQDMRYTFDGGFGSDFMDCFQVGPSERLYQVQSSVDSYNCHFSNFIWNCTDCLYCDHCFGCHNCFGCVGLRHKDYCILNRQFTKDEYQRGAAVIASAMQKRGEWGEFFPMTLSPFAYDEVVSQQYYPRSQAEVQALGLRWCGRAEQGTMAGGADVMERLPATIEGVDDGYCDKVLCCQASGKAYKMIKAELDFYRKTGMPIPRFCPDVRHAARLDLRNPRRLWARRCEKCGAAFESSYALDRHELVYCEECYGRSRY